MNSGMIAVNKPEGISSGRLVASLKKIFGIKKIGHTGTLDPFASGLMLCGINKGTRLSRFFLDGSKRYRARVCLGVETDTQDLTGTVTHRTGLEGLELTEEIIHNAVAEFSGKQRQVPPVYSALKHKGKPLYQYAREGKPVTKPPREIEIYEIRLEHVQLPYIDIDVYCSSGTYIRTLGSDIGRSLGTGAHLTRLCRTQTCGYSLTGACTLDDLESMHREDAFRKITPLAEAVSFLPAVRIGPELVRKVRFGQRLTLSDIFNQDTGSDNRQGDEPIRLLTPEGDLAAIVQWDDNVREYNYSCVFTE
ncbi:MAG: tRNA pseudouridine(55) synthase TruB [Desulfobacteraceae bacterium]|mgnify:CR=1 FL=1|nr:MAG: tRNA pseudouridine(55) synthase TruB [Desulfobacteraceae bacterium]